MQVWLVHWNSAWVQMTKAITPLSSPCLTISPFLRENLERIRMSSCPADHQFHWRSWVSSSGWKLLGAAGTAWRAAGGAWKVWVNFTGRSWHQDEGRDRSLTECGQSMFCRPADDPRIARTAQKRLIEHRDVTMSFRPKIPVFWPAVCEVVILPCGQGSEQQLLHAADKGGIDVVVIGLVDPV